MTTNTERMTQALPYTREQLDTFSLDGIRAHSNSTLEAVICRLIVTAKHALAQHSAEQARCPHCDGTDHVHDATGEWRGTCNCWAAPKQAEQQAGPVGEIVTDCDGETVLGDEVVWTNGMPPPGTKLYTHPAPSQERDKVDAERYRWLRGGDAFGFGHPRWARWQVQVWEGNPPHWENVAGEALDAAVDAARAKKEQQ